MMSMMPATRNYVETITYEDATSGTKIISRKYFDALGRQIQQVVGSAQNSVVQAVEYDVMGRNYRKWKPVFCHYWFRIYSGL